MTDPLDRTLAQLLARLSADGPAIVLVDGRSGSGKTTLARGLAARWPRSTLVRLDDIYPGWDGLRQASDALVGELLEPLRAGLPGRWTEWDWLADVAGPVHPVAPGARLVVEGCGALSRRSRPLADLAVWIELDTATRKRRALARDGDTYAPHWDRWADQEEEFLAAEHPADLADLVIDGSTMAG